MTSGFHSHYCPACKVQKDCVQITHCHRGSIAKCVDCIWDEMQEAAREKLAQQTAKREG